MENSGVPKLQKPTLKIILVGASGVGKTCLIASYFKQSFDFQSIPTVAPAYSCSDVKRKDGTTVSLQIWDTAGQERYHSVSKLFFRALYKRKRNYSWRKMKSTLLMRIANTIMANYDNTEKTGLFDGKMGLCLFFYNCSKYTGCEYYAKTASVLLDEVFKGLNPSMSPSVTDVLTGNLSVLQIKVLSGRFI